MGALTDMLVTFGVFAALGFIILSRVSKTNPGAIDRIKEFIPWDTDKNKMKIKPSETMERIYPENRSVL